MAIFHSYGTVHQRVYPTTFYPIYTWQFNITMVHITILNGKARYKWPKGKPSKSMSPSLASSTGLTGAARTSRGDIFGRSGLFGAKGWRRRLPWVKIAGEIVEGWKRMKYNQSHMYVCIYIYIRWLNYTYIYHTYIHIYIYIYIHQ